MQAILVLLSLGHLNVHMYMYQRTANFEMKQHFNGCTTS